MTLREYARRLGIGYTLARERWQAGQIPGAYKTKGNRVVVPESAKGTNMKLSDYAKSIGVSYMTAWRMFGRGEIPGAFKLDGKTILVPVTRAHVNLSKAPMEFSTDGDMDLGLCNGIAAVVTAVDESCGRIVAEKVLETIYEVTGLDRNRLDAAMLKHKMEDFTPYKGDPDPGRWSYIDQ